MDDLLMQYHQQGQLLLQAQQSAQAWKAHAERLQAQLQARDEALDEITAWVERARADDAGGV